jgi:hypothetical protein
MWEDQTIRRFALAVRYGDMTIEGALKAYAEYQSRIAEEYRKLAVDTLACSMRPIIFCHKCAKDLTI